MRSRPWLALAVTMLIGFTGAGHADPSVFQLGARIDAAAEGHQDVWAAGGQVTVLGNVQEDVWVAGGTVEIDVVAHGDLWAAGGSVEFRGHVGQDAWIAGGSVEIAGNVANDLHVAAANLKVADSAQMGPGSKLYAANVVFNGAANGALSVAGDEVEINGHVRGPLTIQGRIVHIGDSAQIDSDVTVRMIGEPDVAPGAKIAGKLSVVLPRAEIATQPDWGFYSMISVAFAASAFIIGAAWMLLMPAVMRTAAGTLRNRTGLAFINGLLAAIGGPVVAAALVLTLVAAPLGLFLVLAFPLLALAGHAVAGYVIGERLFGTAGTDRPTVMRRLVMQGVGVLIVSTIGLLPYIGIPIVLLILTLGVGAALLAFAEHLFGFAAKSAT